MTKHLFAASLLIIIIFKPLVGECQGNSVPKEFQKDIEKLLKITGTDKMAIQVGSNMANILIEQLRKDNPKIPEDVIAAVKDETTKIIAEKMPDLMNQVIVVYAKYFTRQEVKGLIDFYQTPLGKKTIRTMPQIVNETMFIGQEWGKSFGTELGDRIETRLKKMGY